MMNSIVAYLGAWRKKTQKEGGVTNSLHIKRLLKTTSCDSSRNAGHGAWHQPSTLSHEPSSKFCIHQSLSVVIFAFWLKNASAHEPKIFYIACQTKVAFQWHLLSLLNEHKGCVRIVSTPFQLPLCCANTINRECLILPEWQVQQT
jgi:hypothetical protein